MDKNTHSLVVFVVKAFLTIGIVSIALGLYGHNEFVVYTGVGLTVLSLILTFIYGFLIPELKYYQKVQVAKNLKELEELTR